MKRIHLLKEPNLLVKYDAFPYQKEAFEAIKDLDYAAIFHEQGLGKTKIAIDLLLYWLERTSIDTVLIVTKKQLVQNWIREFRNHTFIHPAVIDTNRQNNYYVFSGPSRVVITNFETLVSEKERYQLFLRTRNVAIIIDESAKLKNPSSNLTRAFFELASLFQKRVIMTGTPVANRPYDIWAQIFFLDYGESLGTDFNEFKRQTDLSNNLADNETLRKSFEGDVSEIYERIKTFTVRETKNSGIIELPDKVFIRESAYFSSEQEALYDKICDELRVEVEKDGQIVEDDSSAIVKRLLRLVQVASNPHLVDDAYRGNSAKEEVLDRLIRQIVSKGEKCIVWTNFIENVDAFTRAYSEYGAVKIHGGMRIADRNKSVDRFRTDDSKVLFATPASAKEGLTLTMANHVIFYDRGFSLDDYLQAQDRIHRISQKKTCYVHNIIMEGSIDEWVDVLLQAKENAALLAQGDISLSEYQKKADYSFGELIRQILFASQGEETNE